MSARQGQLGLEIPMQRNLRLLPIEEIAQLTSEREAMRLCFDAYNRNRKSEDQLEDWQWASLLKIKKGQLSEYLKEKPSKPKHIPEKIRDQVQALTTYLAIDQYHAYKRGHKLTLIDDNDQLRLKDLEIRRLHEQLAKAKKGGQGDE